jgi:hypothetical protein
MTTASESGVMTQAGGGGGAGPPACFSELLCAEKKACIPLCFIFFYFFASKNESKNCKGAVLYMARKFMNAPPSHSL